ncbi:MAG: glycoside hydrolase family 140 protein [Gemmataceae bacterium]|nr:glycoside hydrolase family 140 protein [Gemmataceae bacterium]
MPRPILCVILSLVFGLTGRPIPLFAEAPHRIKVSDNRRYLVTEDGKPFFYLGDTAWELFHRLNREEAEHYLRDRAGKGFTVIQAVVLAELDGLKDPNPYGQTPLIENDPRRPNEKYFEHVDWIVAKANELGLVIGMLPTWGDKWNKKWAGGPEIFDPANAAVYGEWLGRRYKDRGIIWILGGDRPIETDQHREIIRAMAKGLRRGDEGRHLITFHPMGGQGSADFFHNEEWLDFNMRQNGHGIEFTGRYDKTRRDYDRTPIKPVLDGEPAYEDHPVAFKPQELGYNTAADVRRAIYWDLFSGAMGHTYGHHSIWQMYAPTRQPINNPLMTWREALAAPGAGQMQFARKLLESRPMLQRIPDETIIIPEPVATAIPGAGTRRFAATRDQDGSYAMVYVPVGRPFQVRMEVIRGSKVVAWWFDPRTGKAERIGEFTNMGAQRFTPPTPGELTDWVLVLDDAAKGYPPPGQGR